MPQSNVIPGMLYRNAPEAIEWLCYVFGFERRSVIPGPNNTIMHAELTLGGGMIMLGSATDNKHGAVMKVPNEIGEQVTGSINLVVPDADSVYARAKQSGAKIVFEIEDKPYGGRGFACLDPEGQLWHIGTYDPWGSGAGL